MLRTALRLFAFALVTSLIYGIASALLNYWAICVLNLHAPAPIWNEWAMYKAALGYFVPGVLLLGTLGLCMAWRDGSSASSKTLAAVAITSGLIIALLEALEALPRNHLEWLAFLLPVAVVLVPFVLLKIGSARHQAGERDV